MMIFNQDRDKIKSVTLEGVREKIEINLNPKASKEAGL